MLEHYTECRLVFRQQGQSKRQVRCHRQSTRKTTLDSYSSDLGEDKKFALPLQKVRRKGHRQVVTKSNDRDAAADKDKDNLHLRESTKNLTEQTSSSSDSDSSDSGEDEKFALPLQKVRMKGHPQMVTKSNDRDAAADKDKDKLHLRESTKKTTEQTSSSSDSDSSDLEDEEKFALMLQKVRMKGHPQMVTKSNDRDAAADNDKDSLHLNTEIQNVCPLGLEEAERKSVKETNGFEQASAGKDAETASAQQAVEVDWPLKDEFHFRLACRQCFVKTGEGIKGYNYKEGLHHNCACDIMLIKLKQRPDIKWIKVRPRAKHFGKIVNGYKICFHFTAGEPCSLGEEKCTFPHHVTEKRLWEMDRNGEFNIQSFIREIMRNKRLSSQPTQKQFQPQISAGDQGSQQAADADEMPKLEIPLKSEYDFRIMCKECLVNDTQPRLSVHKPHVHNCEQNVLALYKRGEPSVLMRVRERTNHRDFPGSYIICNSIKYGRPDMCRFGEERCSFAHNRIEQILWTQEKEGSFNVSEFILQNRSATGGAKGYTVEELLKKHGGNLKFICRQCFCARPPRIEELERKGYCSANREHSWKNSKVLAHIGSQGGITIINKRVFVHKSAYFKFCYWKSFCKNSLTGSCPFAHSMVERDVWMCERDGDLSQEQVVDKCNDIMFGNDIDTLDKLAKKASCWTSNCDESLVAASRPVTRPLVPYNLKRNNYCQYCGVQCNSEKQWDDHCATERHNFNVNSDKDHQWNFRQPLWIMRVSSYKLCERHMTSQSCQYSNVPEMYNFCMYAHSQEELDEWKERYECRQMKRDMAKQQKVFSYMDKLLDKYESTDSGFSVISEEVNDVDIQCSDELHVYKEEKNAVVTWSFIIRPQSPLVKTALLLDKDRLHFTIQMEDGRNHQIAQGDDFEDVGNDCYRVIIQFTGRMFGSFSQWVIFDFGTYPVLVRKLSVEVGNHDVHNVVKSLRQKLSFDRWTSQNREIVRQPEPSNPADDQLLQKYKAPDASECLITQDIIIAELNCNNYIHKMHKLLELEELTRHKIISSFNICTTVQIQNNISETVGSFYARPGELFMRVPLSDNLTEDTNAGRLILTSVKKIWFAPSSESQKRVFEANILDSSNYDFDGRGKEYIYLCVAPVCVQALGLEAGSNVEVEIQFQMNRLHFCRMHFAIDCLKNTDIVFPHIENVNLQWREAHVSSKYLNENQMKAVQHIVAKRVGYSPPFIMYGPFGTGKTETLAQATMMLIKESKSARILICAQSNSAADRYIVNYLDQFLKERNLEDKLRRVYFKERRVNTVKLEVQKYCAMTERKDAFIPPFREDIMQHSIVITTVETSLELLHLNLRGYFTHIFVDEAAQVLECEIIMPLSLATEKTCIVLTGDHMQMSPRVYSPEARKLNFHVSLLQRLCQHYHRLHEEIGQKNVIPHNVFLSINYRTKKEILQFISAIFYGGPDRLKAQGSIPSVEITPLVFYAVQGCEIQEADSTSYYNISEIQEVVERVDELYKNWPIEWGPQKGEDIMVVAAYHNQVLQIRNALRKKRRELRSVNVSRIHEVQGKEFRALFISTCRTRHLLESDHIQNAECEDFGFLSDPKLLNTALTRAQSFVAIVGDPVALCSIGECVQMWRKYIKHCHNMKSLYPRTLTYKSIKNQVINLQMSPEGQQLEKIMEITSQSSRMPHLVSTGNDKVHDDKQTSKSTCPTVDDWDVNFMIEPDEIIKHLAKEAMKEHQLCTLQDKARTQGILPPREDSIETDGEILKIECITVKEQKGYAVVYYNSDRERENCKRKLLSGADAGVDFDSDDDIDHDAGDEFSETMGYKNYEDTELNKLLVSDPDHYKRCILNIESSQRMFASVVDFASSVQEIKIGSRRHCGHAFHQDEVVVEILTPDKDVTGADVGDDGVNGQVVGILRRAMDPHYRSFVCAVEVNNTGIMIPLNRGLPKIYNLSTKTHMKKAKKGHVCVYHFTKDKEINFSHYEKIDPSDPQGKLFLVRYLKWQPSCSCPLGIVVGVISAGRTVEKGVAILNIEHNVHRKYKQETETEVKALYHHDYQLPRDVYQTRHNITDRWCFTVDAPSTNDLDDALSIDQLPDGNYEVGVHIADVSYFVKRNSCIDAEALQQMTSLYPLNDDPVHMLPQRLSVDLCSLQPGKDRLTLSIFLNVTGTGEITKVHVKKCIINSKQRFSYKEVEDILHDPAAAETDYLKSYILMLYHIAQQWRSNRLGNESHVVRLDPLEKQTPNAHQMIETLMITTNHEVAKKLLECYPETIPVKCQNPLNPEKAEEWKSRHAGNVLNTVALTKPFLKDQKTCNCQEECLCIIQYMQQHGIKGQNSLDVPKDLWSAICEASDVGNLELVQQLILEPQNYPQLALAQLDLWKISSKSKYACSGDLDPVNRGHFSLNLDVYTTFTSPIRRYMDLVVHRLVEAMIDHRPSPYSKLDIRTLCTQNTYALTRAKQYHQDIYSLHLSAALRDKPLVLYPVIENCDDRNLTLQFPTVKEIPPKHRHISMSLLMPRERPKVTDDPKEVSLKWQERIYNTNKDTKPKGIKVPAELDPDQYIVKIPTFQWKRLLTAIRTEDFEELQDSLSSVRQQVESLEIDGHFAEDVCSEVSRNGKINNFVEFSLSFHSCMVLRVQVASELSRGLLCPTIQLLGLTPSLDVCLEHRSSPMTCFSTVTVVSASRQTYADEAAYQKSWLPVLAIESATNAVTSQENVYIHNINIEWTKIRSPSGVTDVVGTFHLPLEFYEERQIKFSDNIKFDSFSVQLSRTPSQSYFLDYLCVRYTGLSIPCGSNVAEKVSAILSEDKPVCWVGHCCVTSVTKEKSGQLIVQLKLHQSAVQFPHLLLSNGPTTNCTIELIPRTLSDRRMDFAVRCLQEGSKLAKDIATGRKPVDKLNYRDVGKLRQTQFDTLLPLNSTQEDAIQQALKQPFTVIQGPPGTGKSLTSVNLARRFVERNRSASVHPTDSQPQVLFCGPSNKSVDVIAVDTLDKLAKKASSWTSNCDESLVAASRPVTRQLAPYNLKRNNNYCQYCGVQCDSEKQWDDHCALERHNFNVNSDKDHQWNFRQPPWGSSYKLCERHMTSQSCQYSHVPEMYNFCMYAHSQEELDEWKERYKWRQMKRDMAKQQKVFSYMDEILDKYESTDSGISVISEEVNGVAVQCADELHVYKEEKNAVVTWSFIIRSQFPLLKTALLLDKDRLHFTIQMEDGRNHQITQGDVFEDVDNHGNDCYRVIIQFTGRMFGSFSQWVIFDFGTYPVLVHKLSVEVGNQDVHNVVKALRQKFSVYRWTNQNREIVRQPEPSNPVDDQLLQKYKIPDASECVVTQDSIITELNRNNYIHKMHKLLELEELTRHQIISSYNIQTTVQIQNNISETKGLFCAKPGELFMKVPLSDNLTEDTNAGRLILTSVKKIWFAPLNQSQKQVFEANILDSSNYGFDGRGKEYIYLCVPPVCVQALGFEAGSNVEVEVQFQMNRIHFCRMHFAVDCLQNTDIVFPDIVNVNPQWNERHIIKISSKVLNEDQMKAVRHIVAEHVGYSPPFIMYGPFGTGKTETLAQATMMLIKESKSARILICTQSNSAADRYIVKYLDPFLKECNQENKLRRVYFQGRRLDTVKSEVQKYCTITERKDAFISASHEDIIQHRIVITTVETSLELLHLNLRGYFTHIFVDEAAQVLECEIIMPLSLATEKTCIVLTGDHMQMNPHVYSPEARKLNFHVSLLQRLCQHYDRFHKQLNQENTSPLNVFLSMNYRTKKEILQFISAIFYGGPDRLKAQGSIPSVEITPMVFYAVQGCEIQEADSTSYYNISEIQEVVERVDELYKNWPVEWGPQNAEDIMVVAAYHNQVSLIRKALRKKKKEYRFVGVNMIYEVQGKEFRALFISTCRTRHLLESGNFQNIMQSADGTIEDFGFLSDPKLLNTALTRAQSFVAIVGDPVALCSIGECVQVWRKCIKECHNMKSLHPCSLTYESIKNQVINLQMSPEGQQLENIMEMTHQSSRMPRLIPTGDKNIHHKDQKSWSSSSQQPNAVNKQNLNTLHPTPHQIYNLDDWNVDFMIEPDEIIKYLAKEDVKADRLRALQDKARVQGILPPKEESIEVNDEILKIECIKVKEQKGYAVVCYNFDRKRENRKRKLSSEVDAGVDFDSDVDTDDEDIEEISAKKVYKNYGVQELNKLLVADPDHYKHCIMNIESSQRMFASVVDFTSSVQEIKIGSRRLCGHAFHQDEVVVEILTPDKDVTGADVGDDGVNGQVVGILRKVMDLHYRLFVCAVEVNNTGIMIPLNKGLPKIYNLSTKTRMQKAKKGHVCVYQFTKDKKINFSHYEKIDPSDPQGKLFLVRYLKWEPSFYSPLGIVVGVINAGRTVEEGVAILDIEHNVHRKYKQETETEVKTLYQHDYQLPRDVYQTRHNITDKWCFTVDAPSTDDLDDALSIDQLPDGNYEVGVHIADVSYFVKRNSCIDAEALQQMTSLYPLNSKPVHMLPQRLSVGLCSLKPGKDRLTLSIFLHVTGTGEITKVHVKKCIINSKQQFSYKEVEDILHDPAAVETDYPKSCILMLYHIAQQWRSNRLGNESHVVRLDPLEKQTPKAHQMIETLMITTNHEVAKKLLECYPETIPVKCQKPLNPEKVEEWKIRHAGNVLNTVALTKPFLKDQKTCNCQEECICIIHFMQGHGIKGQNSLDVQKKLWNAICEASDVGNLELVQQLILEPQNHPQLALAQLDLMKISNKSKYACSGDLDPVNQGHFSLNLDVYTTFTSPIRRYMDLVVHRLVEAMIDHRPCPYSKLDLQTLCIQNTDALTRAKKYHQDIYSLHLSAALRDKPLVLYPVVENCDDRNLILQFPTVKEIPPKHRNISMSLLMPRERPEVTDDPKEVSLKWQERIYNTSKDTKPKGIKGPAELDPDQYIVKIPTFQWQRLLTAIRTEDFEELQDSLSSVRQQVESLEIDGHFAEDVCLEVSRNGKINHFVEFSLSFHSCMVLRVQVASELSKGLLCPTVQLLGLTPSLDVCLEHRSSPMNCFSTVTVVSASRQTYADEAAYQKSWLPVLAIESATNAVTSQENVYIHNINIEWTKIRSHSGVTDVVGTFRLPLQFCEERQIKFSGNIKFDSFSVQLSSTPSQSYFLDYLCVRYTGLSIPCGSNVAEKVSAVLSEDKPVCWVGHCCVTSVTKEKNGQLIVQLKLHQSAVQFPHLLLSNGPTTSCTIEWIPRTLPDRRMDFAVRCLQEGSELAKDIATGRKPVDNCKFGALDL
ncbi:uncharacterized protein LOC121379626 [Gigantopelta aegis]|uniref:uncharacterized protein LOC121379626 n=1 Tax=Gigantopelta aegis TaxID=1735272 RepID=UPI001B88ACB0|nr:uncharacterized protein LOC121379626 [Gigantopelta aegis]